MADERDPQVSKRYRELGADEPPRTLDQAILAASRRAVESRPAPLVVPAGKRRWYFPVAAAAIITLAVAVTVQVERQKPDDELVASVPPRPRMQEQSAPQMQKEEQQAFKAPAGPQQPRPAAKPKREPQGFTPEPPPAAPAPQTAEAPRELAKSNEQAAAAAQGSRAEEARSRSDAARDSAAAPASPPVAAQMQRKAETPEASLERIAELRKQGRHEEADKALEEFRKRYPDYRLSDEMKAKVEKK